MAFSQHARACTLNPTLPCPTPPLSPRALSDSSIAPAAGRLCLKYTGGIGKKLRRVSGAIPGPRTSRPRYTDPRPGKAGALQTRTTLPCAFYSSERLRAPMDPILGRVGSLGDGVPEEIAGDNKKFTLAVITAKFSKNRFLLLLARRTDQ